MSDTHSGSAVAVTADDSVTLKRELGLRDLVLFNVAAVLSMRWIAAAAHAGSGSLFLWVAAGILFQIPIALTAANLARRFPQEGGLYIWTREAFGAGHAFACGWFYYISNLFWIPGLIVASIGMVVYSFSAQFAAHAEDPRFLFPVAFALLVVITFTNYVGLSVAKWVDNLGGIGAYVIWGVLVLSAIAFLIGHKPLTHFEIFPRLDLNKLNFWSQLAFGMTGLELSPILGGEVRDPRRTMFRATWISAFLVMLFYIVGTAAILVFLRPESISPVVGLAQAGRQAAADIGWKWIPLVIACSILLSVAGQLGTYVGACARLPFVLGIEKLLPAWFGKVHPKYGTPYVSILVLCGGSGFLLLVSQLGETFRAAYQIMVDMSVITLFIPFLYMFASAWKFGLRLPAASGLFVSVVAILFSFIPTDDVKNVWLFEFKLMGGVIALSVVAAFLYHRYRRRSA
jgi:glutamate:GABA antiporter